MSARYGAALRTWRTRRPGATGDRAYLAYCLVLVGLIIGAPVVRAAWLHLAVPTTADALVGSGAAPVATTLVLALWTVALLAGRERGPAVGPPILVHVLVSSDLLRRRVFRRSTSVAVVVLAVVVGGLAALVGSAGLVGARAAPGSDLVAPVADVVLRGVLVGIIVAVCWLVGEASPRVAGVLSALLAVCAAAVLVLPDASPGTGSGARTGALTRWAWLPAGAPEATADVVLAVVAVAALAAVPWLLERIETDTLEGQSAAWDLAIAHAVSLELSSVSNAYRVRPAVGRRLRAVGGTAGTGVAVVRSDVVGAVRTPARTVVGLLALAVAGALTVAAVEAATASALLGAAAALLLVVGVGGLSRGLQHAADVAGDLPLYGIGDGSLFLLHCVLPTVAALVVGGGSTVVTAAITGATTGPGVSVVVGAAIVLPLVVVGARVSNALRGPTPLFLMTPMPSPIGDPMVFLRVLWALDAPLLAVLGGVAATTGSAAGLVAVALVLAAFVAVRWSRRR